ncbi:hypothetical protein IR022_12065 [Dysgonomonas sp. GY617]|nr:hypothetical protein [Dysgonomonas sp. GY617]
MYRYSLFILFNIAIVYGSLNTQTTTKNDFDYTTFKSYFGDLLPKRSSDSLLARKSFTEKLYTSDSADEKIYAIGKIDNHKGNDLFVIRKTLIYNDFDERNLDFLALLVFKDETLINGIDNELILENSPISDGGIFQQSYVFEPDTTLTITTFRSDCCSSSGYVTPIENRSTIRFEIDSAGHITLKRIDKCAFSSPFFQIDYLNKMQKDNNSSYPTEDNEYQLQIENWALPINFSEDAIRFFFNVISYNGNLRSQFISRDKQGNTLDTYIVGANNSLAQQEIIQPKGASIKYTINIQTSDGELESTPAGRFKLKKMSFISD